MPAKGSGRKINCGKHGMLTAAEAGAIAGVSAEVIRNRMILGWLGADLCKPPRGRYRIVREKPRFSTMLVALKLAREFDDFDSVPTVSEICQCHAMSTHTALRWRQTYMRAVKEQR